MIAFGDAGRNGDSGISEVEPWPSPRLLQPLTATGCHGGCVVGGVDGGDGGGGGGDGGGSAGSCERKTFAVNNGGDGEGKRDQGEGDIAGRGGGVMFPMAYGCSAFP